VLSKYGESNAALAEATLGRIGSLCQAASGGVDEIVARAGGIEAIVRTMIAHKRAERVQAFGCSLIGMLCDRPKRVKLASAAGGVGAVVDAMGTHPSAVDVQTSGCLSLGGLAADPLCAHEAAGLGAIASVVTALRARPEKPSRQANGCMALANLVVSEGRASDPSRCDAAIKAGALKLIVASIKKFPHHAGVLHWGTTAVLRLTHDSPERAEMAIQAGAKDALHAAAVQPTTHGEALAAKVELAHRWLQMHESLASKQGGGKSLTKAEKIFNDMLWEHATTETALPEAAVASAWSAPFMRLSAWA
jgi:hypothetical protein